MEPIGRLMIEHRLIERMVELLKRERDRVTGSDKVDARFIDRAIDFMRTYADRCHHGKEEDILFRKLTDKELSPEHLGVMEELVKDHARARKMTSDLAQANERYARGERDALSEIAKLLDGLTALYPKHIEMEDKHFFLPCLNYFSVDERKRMLDEFDEFDRSLLHELYKELVKRHEAE